MQFERRSVLVGAGTVAMTSFAGCLADGDAEAQPTNEEGESPKPRVVEVTYPEPQSVSLDNEAQSEGKYEFTVEIENTGTDGEIGIMLVWMEKANDDPNGPNSETVPETTRERFFSSGERRELSVTSKRRDGYEGYGFRLWAAEMDVEIENEGGSGRVEVRMMEGNEIVQNTELMMGAGETTSYTFDSDFSDVDPEEIDIEVESAE